MRLMRISLAAALSILAATPVLAQSAGPYDLQYQIYSPPADGAPLHKGMAAKAPVIAKVPAGAGNITLRWCRPDLPFEAFRFGDDAYKRDILKDSWCEIGWDGKVGDIEGKYLTPQ